MKFKCIVKQPGAMKLTASVVWFVSWFGVSLTILFGDHFLSNFS